MRCKFYKGKEKNQNDSITSNKYFLQFAATISGKYEPEKIFII